MIRRGQGSHKFIAMHRNDYSPGYSGGVAMVKPVFCVVLCDGEKWSVEAEWPDGTIEHVETFEGHSANSQAFVASTPESLQSQKRSIRQNRLSLKGLRRFSRTTTERSIAATCPRSTPSRPTDVLLLKRCVANSKTDTGTRLANNPIVIRAAGQLSPWTMAHFRPLLGRELHGRASRISGVR
jgi:hypothetical protein